MAITAHTPGDQEIDLHLFGDFSMVESGSREIVPLGTFSLMVSNDMPMRYSGPPSGSRQASDVELFINTSLANEYLSPVFTFP